MNIKEATKHIKATITAYLEKDEFNNFVIPIEKQRPLFLYGPPGIGKTAVVEQIAEELGIGIVTYSMTHHTRQSALGLPFIKTIKFGDTEYQVSEYTMSEILASVYNYIEETGKDKGILFLDEINCVSETLFPSMLRFLQYKTFGSHKVPDGWVIVTAGNPPEYNKSVREYDIATLDRIQKISVDSDYGVWREYAVKKNVHPAIISFLDVNKNSFYYIENTPLRKEFVTARGWEDLSRLVFSFEKKGVAITAEFIEQYIQVSSVAWDFAEFYSVFLKLRDDFSAFDVMCGKGTPTLSDSLRKASVSEKIGFINHLCDCICTELSGSVALNKTLRALAGLLKQADVTDGADREASVRMCEALKNGGDSFTVDKNIKLLLWEKVNELSERISNNGTGRVVSEYVAEQLSALKSSVSKADSSLSNAVRFMYDTFGDSPEMRIFTTNITTNEDAALFLISFGCNEFSACAKSDFCQKDIMQELDIIFS